MKKVTIKDLAKLLNLSASTVSRALSDHPDISDATKKRVRLAAEEFNYTTNLHARFFRQQHSGQIALILPEVNMFFSPSLIDGVNKVIGPSSYSLTTFLTDDSYEREKSIIQQCLRWSVAGVLISLSKETHNIHHLAPLKKAGIPCVLLDKTLENEQFHSVTIDNIDASYQAVSYLIRKGHQNIIGLFANPSLHISQERIKGYAKALKETGLPVPEENIISIDNMDNLDFILPPILKHNKQITAIFAMSDELLAKCLYHLKRMGLSIPNDISIIAISDGIYPCLNHPQISHIKDSGSKMGKSACQLLLETIDHPTDDTPVHRLTATRLVELESVRDDRLLF